MGDVPVHVEVFVCYNFYRKTNSRVNKSHGTGSQQEIFRRRCYQPALLYCGKTSFFFCAITGRCTRDGYFNTIDQGQTETKDVLEMLRRQKDGPISVMNNIDVYKYGVTSLHRHEQPSRCLSHCSRCNTTR